MSAPISMPDSAVLNLNLLPAQPASWAFVLAGVDAAEAQALGDTLREQRFVVTLAMTLDDAALA
jgi:hypothetical protein